jgi:alpha-beta hydrolase superfamily lysophospholipase
MMDTRLAQEQGLPPVQPIVFGPQRRSLFGMCHAPAGPAKAVGVVLCNPLGYEALSAHRTYRHLAEHLAARGFLTLRFDYDGTGDSAGTSKDPDRLRAWLDSIARALDEVRARTRSPRVVLAGVRFGATLATLAASEQGGVDALVAWAPIVSGRTHVRELQAFRLLKPVKGRAARPTDGSEEIAGHYFSAPTLASMAAIDLLGLTGTVADRVLLLPRTERATDERRLAERLKANGTDVTSSADTAYAQMMRDDPYEAEVPSAALDGIVDWLDDGRYPVGRAAPPAPSVTTVLRAADPRGEPVVTETPLAFGPNHRLIGVLTEPEGALAHERPTVLLLNVGANHHVGPHRMNVTLSRDLASLGYRAFRFDVSGLGDSLAAPGSRENRIYTKDSCADVASAMTLLGQLRDSRRFVLVGLCSGAYLAYHTAVADERVVGQVLLSSYAFEWKEGDPVAPTERRFLSTRFYTRAVFDRQVWLRAFRGEVQVRGIARELLERARARLEAELPNLKARLLGKRKRRNEIEAGFHALCDGGVQSLLVSSFNDGGLDMIAGYLGDDARKMRKRPEFVLRVVDDADHTFSSLDAQQVLRDLVSRYLADHFP